MPFGIDKKVGGDSPENVSKVEDCVNKISGNNKRTGKPYTKGEKIAICKTSLKKSRSKASIEEDVLLAEAAEEVSVALDTVSKRLIALGKVSNIDQAYAMAEVLLARSRFDIDTFILNFQYLK